MNNPYQILIVDDEEPARELLKSYVQKRGDIELLAVVSDALSAKEIIDKGGVDILFTDIEMDDLTGIDLLKNLKNPPITIFTTAYSEYALQGYHLDVIDYLVKPVSFQKFCKGLDKAIELLVHKHIEEEFHESNPPKSDFIFVKTNRKIVKVNFKEILFVESYGEYVKINTQDDVILALQTMGAMEQIVPPQHFVRIHRSHIVNLNYVKEIEGNMVRLEEHTLSVSKRMREAFIRRLADHGIL